MNRKEEIEGILREKASAVNKKYEGKTMTPSAYGCEVSNLLIENTDLIEELMLIKSLESIGLHLPVKGDDCVEFRKD